MHTEAEGSRPLKRMVYQTVLYEKYTMPKESGPFRIFNIIIQYKEIPIRQ